MPVPVCDIILPVYNSLAYVKQCVASVLAETAGADSYRLLIVDDASDQHTRAWLAEQAAQQEPLELLRNPHNVGFVQSCNRGMRASRAEFVLLLNSDVIVTPAWLERLLACARSDPRIAAVNPLSNHAAQINLPLPPGANFYAMNDLLGQRSPRYPDVVTGVGFCLLLRRAALDQVGLLDEIYGRGYCEESDLCMRLTTQGWRTVVADNCYVYHQGKASFSDAGLSAYRHNRQIFDQRWAAEYRRQFRAFRRAAPLQTVRQDFAYPTYWHPLPQVWLTYRAFTQAWRQRRVVDMLLALARGLFHSLRARQPQPTAEQAAALCRPGRLRVTYVVPKLVIAGGVLSVVQLVNELILLGVEARIVTLFQDKALDDWQLLSRPLVYPNWRTLLHECPPTDVLVATHWHSAAWVAELARRQPQAKTAYFIQDYEAWFYPENDPHRAQVKASYALIPQRIVKSAWLRDLLAKDGYTARQIHLGMNLDVFYPRDKPQDGRLRLLAMARPGTPWRGFESLVAALAEVKRARPAVEIILFGDSRLSAQPIPFAYTDKGIVSRREDLARLYSQADVYFDSSDYQGFGRPALEAMACGAACVLTPVGGVSEYARDGENCLAVAPKQPQAMAAALLRVLDSAALREQLVRGGFATLQDYDVKREARETLAYFAKLYSPCTQS